MSDPSDILRAKLNLETARLAWPEIERHFARGVVLQVASGMDLVEVALQIANNNTETVQAWLSDRRLAKADSSEAEDWHRRRAEFWAVVVAPWVLVQEISASMIGRTDS
jgi:hypothetical protein